ncbi:MAG: DUF2059 domain-containing protein [Pseudomonadota bacterium]
MRIPSRFAVASLAVGLAAVIATAPLRPGPSPWAMAQAQGAAGSDAPAQADAETRQEVDALLAAMGMDELLPIMRAEGIAYAEELGQEMFPNRAEGRWMDIADRIYRVDRMRAVMLDGMADGLAATDLDPLDAFFSSELGRRIVRLEVSAREALLDESVEEASLDALDDLRGADDPRLDVLEGFIVANDLVEMNVVGALNSNIAFYQGLQAGGAFNGALTDDQMLADVWSQEDEIRSETLDWVYSYLGLAYQPLSDADIERYTELSLTPEGQALNTSLFAAFDTLYTTISRDLGLAAATFMAGEDI